jgi:glutathione synthase/RimK-type ligase-like ATP-grasp enzyme
MSETQATEFERQSRPEDELLNGWSELIRSKDYSNEELYTLERLQELGVIWMNEEDNPLRSPRGQAEAKHIAKLLAFECAYRKGQVQVLIDFYGAYHE